jgi:hypothetical protein
MHVAHPDRVRDRVLDLRPARSRRQPVRTRDRQGRSGAVHESGCAGRRPGRRRSDLPQRPVRSRLDARYGHLAAQAHSTEAGHGVEHRARLLPGAVLRCRRSECARTDRAARRADRHAKPRSNLGIASARCEHRARQLDRRREERGRGVRRGRGAPLAGPALVGGRAATGISRWCSRRPGDGSRAGAPRRPARGSRRRTQGRARTCRRPDGRASSTTP